MTWLWILAITLMFILGWEFLSLVTKQERIPTWSRLIRAIWQRDRPELKPMIFVVTLTLTWGFGLWMAIHFVTPEGWLWDEFLFLLEDFCTASGIPC